MSGYRFACTGFLLVVAVVASLAFGGLNRQGFGYSASPIHAQSDSTVKVGSQDALDPSLLTAITIVHPVQGDCNAVSTGSCFLTYQRDDGIVEVTYGYSCKDQRSCNSTGIVDAQANASQRVLFAPIGSTWLPITKDIETKDNAGPSVASLLTGAALDTAAGTWEFDASIETFTVVITTGGTGRFSFRTRNVCADGQVSTDSVGCDGLTPTDFYGGWATVNFASASRGVVQGTVVQTNDPSYVPLGPAYLVLLTDGSLYFTESSGSIFRLCNRTLRPGPAAAFACGPNFPGGQ